MVLMKPVVQFDTRSNLSDSEVMDIGDWIDEELGNAAALIAKQASQKFGHKIEVEVAE